MPADLGLLAPTAGAAKEVLGVERIEAVADKGYYKGEDMQACENVGIEAYIARPQRGSAVRDGLFRKDFASYLCFCYTGGSRYDVRYKKGRRRTCGL